MVSEGQVTNCVPRPGLRERHSGVLGANLESMSGNHGEFPRYDGKDSPIVQADGQVLGGTKCLKTARTDPAFLELRRPVLFVTARIIALPRDKSGPGCGVLLRSAAWVAA